MTNKWRWILLFWHSWRSAVWHAEGFLHDEGSPAYRRIESLRDYHSYSAKEMHRALFPPPPTDWDEVMRTFRKTPLR